jgi:hypothetical protein
MIIVSIHIESLGFSNFRAVRSKMTTQHNYIFCDIENITITVYS